MTGDKDGFGVSGCKGFAGFGSAGLHDDGSTLWRGFTDVWTGNLVVLAHMVDGLHQGRVSIHDRLRIKLDSIITPGSLPGTD